MKTRYIIIIAIAVVISLIAIGTLTAAAKKRSTDITGLATASGYQDLCVKNSDQWMVMEPLRNGKKISDQACAGCMIGGNHFCAPKEYVDYVKSLPAIGSPEKEERMMAHSAMVAHGGYKNSVAVHKYNVEFVRSRAAESKLVFRITETTSGKPVSDLDIVHDKIMHLILVRDDLRYFDHIHPQQTEPGIYTVPYEFLASGIYRTWIDFTIGGMQHIVDFDLDVSVTSTEPEPDRLYDINADMKAPDVIKVGESTRIDFAITDSGNMPVPINEKFLAANAHLVAIDETLEEFVHNHDEDFDGDNILSFEQKFTKAGEHKLWIQFSVDGKDRTAEFAVDVV